MLSCHSFHLKYLAYYYYECHFSVLTYILRIIISHTPYHYIPYSVTSFYILYVIISHCPYHLSCSVSSHHILRIIISHTCFSDILQTASEFSGTINQLEALFLYQRALCDLEKVYGHEVYHLTHTPCHENQYHVFICSTFHRSLIAHMSCIRMMQ